MPPAFRWCSRRVATSGTSCTLGGPSMAPANFPGLRPATAPPGGRVSCVLGGGSPKQTGRIPSWLRLQTTPATGHRQPLADSALSENVHMPNAIEAPRDSERTAGGWATPLEIPTACGLLPAAPRLSPWAFTEATRPQSKPLAPATVCKYVTARVCLRVRSRHARHSQ